MIITLTTDFGLSDPFVGIMKGVMLSIAPNAQLVDITHDIPSHDTMDAAFIIDSAFRYFPSETIHVVVVDPGVGGVRRPIAAFSHGHYFIAPDNGALSLVLRGETGAEPAVHHITNFGLFRRPVSHTFHGRDVFAPVAAHLANGASIDSVGPRILDFVRKSLPRPRRKGEGDLVAAVLHIDRFGNIITNLRRRDLPDHFVMRIGEVEIRRLLSSYDQGKPDEFFAIEGSAGYVELSLNQGSAAQRLRIRRGVEIEVETEASNQYNAEF